MHQLQQQQQKQPYTSSNPRPSIKTSAASPHGTLQHHFGSKLSFRTSRERSSTSLLSLSSGGNSLKTPRTLRRATNNQSNNNDSSEKMVTIKCQRLTADRTCEEIEVEVPASVYETMRAQTEREEAASASPKSNNNNFDSEQELIVRSKRSLASKIKSIFAKA